MSQEEATTETPADAIPNVVVPLRPTAWGEDSADRPLALRELAQLCLCGGDVLEHVEHTEIDPRKVVCLASIGGVRHEPELRELNCHVVGGVLLDVSPFGEQDIVMPGDSGRNDGDVGKRSNHVCQLGVEVEQNGHACVYQILKPADIFPNITVTLLVPWQHQSRDVG